MEEIFNYQENARQELTDFRQLSKTMNRNIEPSQGLDIGKTMGELPLEYQEIHYKYFRTLGRAFGWTLKAQIRLLQFKASKPQGFGVLWDQNASHINKLITELRGSIEWWERHLQFVSSHALTVKSMSLMLKITKVISFLLIGNAFLEKTLHLPPQLWTIPMDTVPAWILAFGAAGLLDSLAHYEYKKYAAAQPELKQMFHEIWQIHFKNGFDSAMQGEYDVDKMFPWLKNSFLSAAQKDLSCEQWLRAIPR